MAPSPLGAVAVNFSDVPLDPAAEYDAETSLPLSVAKRRTGFPVTVTGSVRVTVNERLSPCFPTAVEPVPSATVNPLMTGAVTVFAVMTWLTDRPAPSVAVKVSDISAIMPMDPVTAPVSRLSVNPFGSDGLTE